MKMFNLATPTLKKIDLIKKVSRLARASTDEQFL